jgi:endonuclease-3
MAKRAPTSRLKPSEIEAIFTLFAQADPHPKTELIAPNPFCLLVAVVLSAQATDVSVNKATKDLFIKADSPEKLLTLGEEGIKRYIKTIGLFNTKAKNIMGLCRKVLEEFGGELPHDRDKLASLPGVGRKTANVWLNCVLGWPTLAVDTHVFRVANRLGLAKASNPLQCELQLEKAIPAHWKTHAHHWLILHGRYVCKARAPLCSVCAVSAYCKEYRAQKKAAR